MAKATKACVNKFLVFEQITIHETKAEEIVMENEANVEVLSICALCLS